MNSGFLSNLGLTRSVRRSSYVLQSPDTFIRTQIPGSSNAAVIFHISPAMGAAFTQYSVEFGQNGQLGDAAGQRFIFTLEGSVTLETPGQSHLLKTGSYAYIPQGQPHRIIALEPARAAVIEKGYQAIDQAPAPDLLVGRETDIAGQPLMGNEALQVRSLLPDTMTFDLAVNTMTYQPGAGLSMVEVHVMEHGLLMLEGGGIYRLDEDWHPVTAGDFIWMAPYCPQWFAAIGKAPAKYLIYKDWNRHPLREP